MSNNTPNRPTKVLLGIRILVSAYILYLAYGIITSDTPKSWYMWIFVVIFVGAGLTLITLSAKALIKGEYIDGAFDTEEEEVVEATDTDNVESVAKIEEESVDSTDVEAEEVSKSEIIEEK